MKLKHIFYLSLLFFMGYLSSCEKEPDPETFQLVRLHIHGTLATEGVAQKKTRVTHMLQKVHLLLN